MSRVERNMSRCITAHHRGYYTKNVSLQESSILVEEHYISSSHSLYNHLFLFQSSIELFRGHKWSSTDRLFSQLWLYIRFKPGSKPGLFGINQRLYHQAIIAQQRVRQIFTFTKMLTGQNVFFDHATLFRMSPSSIFKGGGLMLSPLVRRPRERHF